MGVCLTPHAKHLNLFVPVLVLGGSSEPFVLAVVSVRPGHKEGCKGISRWMGVNLIIVICIYLTSPPDNLSF
jgi:hypothetical protein